MRLMDENKALIPSIGNYLNAANTRKFVESMLKERTGSFITSLVSIQNLNKSLQGCDPNSLMMCGLKAASLGLPLDPNLGHAYPVPYNVSKKVGNEWVKTKEAQFQLGYKGFIQLAQRTSQYKKIVLTDIRAGEVVKIDPIAEIYEFCPVLDEDKRSKLPVSHYYFMFELVNGFKKEFCWPIGKLLAHGKRYSKSFGDGPWQTNQDEMCKKTMIRLHLPKWGPMSIEMQEAIQADQAVLKVDETTGQELPPEYADNTQSDVIEGDYTVESSETVVDSAEEEFRKIQEQKKSGKSAEGQQDVFDKVKEASK
jgi:recombination protein RecT